MLHWISVAISQIGSFFAGIALPWLVLSISNNDPVQMSTIVSLSSLPYAVFILFGGALTDRISPLRLLFVTRAGIVLLMASLSLLVYLQITPFWLLALFALVLGTLNAFGVPAGESLLPAILSDRVLGQGNGIIMGTTHLAQILGPMLAGWILWLGRTLQGRPHDQVDYASLAFAFGLNAVATLLAVIMMAWIRPPKAPTVSHDQHLLQMMWQGLLFCWRDRGIRTVLAYLCLISFFLQGPLTAILPVLSKVKLGLSEAEFGTLYAMIGLGTVIGAGIAVLVKPDPQVLGRWVLVCDALSGLCLYLLGHSTLMSSSCALLLGVGIMGGFIMIAGITWFQLRTPDEFMGRVMSILMFTILGLAPVSTTLTGYLIAKTSLSAVISGGGCIVMFFAIGGLLIPPIRQMGHAPAWRPQS